MLAAVAAFAVGLVVVLAVRTGSVSIGTGIALLVGCAGLIFIGAALGSLRRYPTHVVAQRVDRASGLSDRLGTACAFEEAIASGHTSKYAETVELMHAAVADAVRVAPSANVKAATPFYWPRDTVPAAIFAFLFLIIAGLWWPTDTYAPLKVSGNVTLEGEALPDLGGGEQGDRGTVIITNTFTGATQEIALGTKGPVTYQAELRSGPYKVDFVANKALCADEQVHKMPCFDGNLVEHIALRKNQSRADETYDIECMGAECTFNIDIKKSVGRPENPVAFEEDDLDYTKDLLDDLRRTAENEKDPSLKEFVDKIDRLLTKAEMGELTKDELLEELRKAEENFKENTDQAIEESLKDLERTGQELKKDKLTKELGKALEKGDLEKAQQEMEKLANKLEKGELNEKQKKQLAKTLEKVADKFQKRDEKKTKDLDKKVANQQKKVSDLKKKLQREKNEQKRQALTNRLNREKRELKRLERKKQDRQASNSRRQLKELHRNLKNAAEDLKKNNQNSKQQQKQASQKMRRAQRNTGKVDSDQRKVSTQKKVSSQLTDLREAMRRARQRGSKGPKDLFGKNRRNQDFHKRARGGKGSKTAWKPGSTGKGKGGKGGKGQNGNQPGGKGKQPGGNSWGTGDGGDPLGDTATDKGGYTTDKSVSGVHGKGPSKRETILSAAQKGFARKSYEKVYAAYKAIVEEVMHTEKVPSGYKYYIKRYFQKIKPHAMD